jgi:hypothetical protein
MALTTRRFPTCGYQNFMATEDPTGSLLVEQAVRSPVNLSDATGVGTDPFINVHEGDPGPFILVSADCSGPLQHFETVGLGSTGTYDFTQTG